MPKHNHIHDAQNQDPKKTTRKQLVKQQRNAEIANTTIFDIGFKSDVANYVLREATPDSHLQKLGKECLEWAKSDAEPIKIRQFFRDRDYDYEDIERFRVKSVEFSRYYEMALDVIGDRREAAAYNKKASENIVAFTMALYDPDWKKLRQEKADLARDISAKNTGNITVVMNPIPNCDEVPVKQSKELAMETLEKEVLEEKE